MPHTEENVNDLLERVVKKIDITESMFLAADKEYSDMGKWLDKQSADYSVLVYPQGSFALGTVVRPITDSDDYDLDLVCEFADSYGLSAREMKHDIVKPWLMRYRKTKKDLEEKRCCWHVEYDDLPNFHMDVIPAYSTSACINITEHNEDNNTYRYTGSNPKGYIEWFTNRSSEQWQKLYRKAKSIDNVSQFVAEVETLDRYRIKTPLQKAVQLLKRHRDIMFKDLPDKPISIIITTLAGQLYSNEDTTLDALTSFLANAEDYILQHMDGDQYVVDNPSYPGENFANKWNTHCERRIAFFNWLHQAQFDLSVERLTSMNRLELGNEIKRLFGDTVGRAAISELAMEDRINITTGVAKIDTTTGAISKKGSMAIPANRHYHG